MAHEVESMMYVGQEPWHGLGTKIPADKKLKIDQAIVAAGLDWTVSLRPVFTHNDVSGMARIPDYHAVYRTTDHSVLGIVGADYVPLQNRESFTWFQPFLDEGEATLETAGSLKKGRRVWVLARIKRDEFAVSGKDEVANYILLSNSHDGSLAVRVGFTPIRVVCNNTLCLAHESKASKLLRVRHTTSLQENLAYIREIMNVANAEFQATAEQYQTLASKKIDLSDLERYVRHVFDLKEPSGKNETIVPTVTHLFQHGRGSDLAGPTYWGAYNAVTEYLNYFRGKSQDNRLDSLWFGNAGEINKKALNVALEAAQDAA